MNRNLLIGLLIVVLATVGYLVIHRSGQPASTPTPTATPLPTATPTASASPSTSVSPTTSPKATATPKTTATPKATATPVSSVKTFNVAGGEYFFNPSTITVNKGDTVKIVFSNQGGVHNWVIDQFNARTPMIQSGQTATVQFVADKAGSFEYYCSVGEHRALGMKGTLIVK